MVRQMRFDLLDGLRGIAAVAVMLFHYAKPTGLGWFSGAWAAVDVFFVLSGLVIAHSYGAKIMAGMGFARFAAVRLIRLGPLYLLGLVLGVAGVLPLADPAEVARAALLGLFWLPDFGARAWPFGAGLVSGDLYPLNNPAWSLFFELAVNGMFFGYVVWRRQYASVLLVACAGLALAMYTLLFGDVGPGWGGSTFWWGFPRVIAMFFGGALMVQMGVERGVSRPWLAVPVAVLGVVGFAVPDDHIALLDSLVVLPLTVALLAPVRVGAGVRRVCAVLGELSYPLYVLHFPLYRILFATTKLRSLPPVWQTVIAGVLAIALALAIAPLDRRVRRALLRWLPA